MAGIPKDINTTYDVVGAFRAIEDELTASMIRNLDHHRAEELEAGLTGASGRWNSLPHWMRIRKEI